MESEEGKMENLVKTMDKNFWVDKKVLITRITGFLGAYLAKDLLEKKAVVFGIVRDDDPASNLTLQGIEGRRSTLGQAHP